MSINNTLATNENVLNLVLTGRLGIAIGITTIVSIVTLSLLYSGFPVFGPINDLTNAVGGLLSALLVWQFHALLQERAPRTASFYLIIAWVGSAAIIINSLLVAAGLMDWKTGGMYTALGLGLQGIWLFALLRLIGPQPFLSPGLIRLGSIAAVAMWFGLLAGPLLVGRISLEIISSFGSRILERLVVGCYILSGAGLWGTNSFLCDR
ncbi:MAG: hypothetical protein HC806_00370 [Anaerolineae bacterium]|nr:hypothetical protein [Anaerolineae bacterium]